MRRTAIAIRATISDSEKFIFHGRSSAPVGEARTSANAAIRSFTQWSREVRLTAANRAQGLRHRGARVGDRRCPGMEGYDPSVDTVGRLTGQRPGVLDPFAGPSVLTCS